MIAECPHCQASYEIDPSRAPAPRIRLRCSKCQNLFPFDVSASDEVLESPEGEVIDIQELTGESSIVEVDVDDERTERVRPFSATRRWVAVLGGSFLLGGGAYLLWFYGETAPKPKEGHSSFPQEARMAAPLATPMVSPVLTATPIDSYVTEGEPIPTMTATPEAKTPLLAALEKAREEGPSDIVLGLPEENEESEEETEEAPAVEKRPSKKPVVPEEIAAYWKEYAKFTPSALRPLRSKVAKDLHSGLDHDDLHLIAAEVHAYLGGRYSNKEWIQYAHKAAFHWRQKHGGDPRGDRAQALSYLAAGQAKKALPLALNASKKLPKDPIAQFAYGSALIQGGRRDLGIQFLEKAHNQFPNSFPIREILAKTYLKKEQYANVEIHAAALASREPKDPLILDYLSDAYESQAKWKKASRSLSRLAAVKKDWETRFRLGRAYRQTKEFSKAAAELDRVLKKYSSKLSRKEKGEVALERGKVEFDQNQFSKSLVYLKEAHRLRPSDLSTLQYLGGALFRQSRYKEATVVYAQAVKLAPNNMDLLRHLGMAQMESGDLAGAEKSFHKLIRAGHEDASLDYYLARTREAQGDRAGAIAYLERALQKDPNYANAKIRLDKLLKR